MTHTRYLERLRALSEQLLQLQGPIRILDAIKWPARTEEDFLGAGGRQMPAIDADYYQRLGLPFDPAQLSAQFRELGEAVARQLGHDDALGRILLATIDQYQTVIHLLASRGTRDFGRYSRDLYGSPRHSITGDSQSLLELGEKLCRVFSLPAAARLHHAYPKNIEAAEAVVLLREKMDAYFGPGRVRVEISDDIVSDAAAGGDRIKINRRARFSELDIKVLEVHEGWVHIGTTLNGRQQPWATWLSVGSPRITAIQEGMAVLMETLTFSSFPDRARRVSDRVLAVDMAERGADFVEVYRYFRERGDSEHDSYRVTQRVFRGGTLTGGSVFTKDISYVKGFVENVGFIRSAIEAGVPEMIPMLYVGKVTLEDLPVLYERHLDGIISSPAFLPPMFRDVNGLYVWFGFSSNIATLDNDRMRQHFAGLFNGLRATTDTPADANS